MSVRLIGITKSCVEGIPSSQDLLAFCARVSSTANQKNILTGAKLIRSLIRRQEWSPLEMVSMTVEVTTTRDIARQILRHRSFSFQEFSQRYAAVEDPPVFREARNQDLSDRQNSIPVDKPSVQQDWRWAQERVWEYAYKQYTQALRRGMAREVARVLLPEGLTPSRLYMAGTLRSFYHYVELRSTPGTQLEHREIALEIKAIIQEYFPIIIEARNEDSQKTPE